MALDMYFEGQHQAIRDADEYIFTLADSSAAYPALASIWSRFYSEFSITPEEAGCLVNELLALYSAHTHDASRGFAELTLRLACFFSKASVAGLTIKCVGD